MMLCCFLFVSQRASSGLFPYTELLISSLIVRCCAWRSCIALFTFLCYSSRPPPPPPPPGAGVAGDVYTILIHKPPKRMFVSDFSQTARRVALSQSVSPLYYALRRSGKSKNFYMRVFGIMKPRLVGSVGRSDGLGEGDFYRAYAGLRLSGWRGWKVGKFPPFGTHPIRRSEWGGTGIRSSRVCMCVSFLQIQVI